MLRRRRAGLDTRSNFTIETMAYRHPSERTHAFAATEKTLAPIPLPRKEKLAESGGCFRLSSMNEARAKAWETRRQKYGARGHAGSYSRGGYRERRALTLIARLCRDAVLSEGQCCKALGMERIEFRILCDELAPA